MAKKQFTLTLDRDTKAKLEQVAHELTRRDGYHTSQSAVFQIALHRYHADLGLDARRSA
jgi:predicted transcriptional regulator